LTSWKTSTGRVKITVNGSPIVEGLIAGGVPASFNELMAGQDFISGIPAQPGFLWIRAVGIAPVEIGNAEMLALSAAGAGVPSNENIVQFTRPLAA
jgi:hypothetical protein